ncbi:methyl-accepting chemotaxis sensory transducer with Cache sensor [Halomonas saccharevitans]|uniref:Methyl-accepting chemotaxis sensory transducer with Cache sensor n=2 Tax=Halomonas saccharevitans TaxID=416872 RepID=A0A1I7CWX6_9GAMM|nr:methyl-accepting chemotaxis sensory transducer with Cache sensor [Halomonas saccharevitans]
MSHLASGIPDVQAALAGEDRDRLAALFEPGFATLKEGGVRQFQFHLPPATSFLRVHKPEKFGDDLSVLRPTIVETNRTQAPVSGVDQGVAGLGIRGIVPVFHRDEHVGSLEFGMSLGQGFFESFANQYGVEAGLHLKTTGGFTSYASSLEGSGLLPDSTLQGAFEGEGERERAVHYTERDGTPLAVMGHVVKDYAGTPIGVVEIALDRTNYVAAMDLARNAALLIAALTLGAGMIVAYWLSRTITRPIKNTVTAMENIAAGEGDLTRRLDDSGRDELSELATQFNAFVARMQQTLREVRGTTYSVYQAAGEISQSSEELATRTEQSAANLQETSASMEEITATVNHSAESASQANQLVQSTAEVARQGKAAMDQVERTMSDINASSAKISDIITMIDSIAFQTNILALNASVEAARAGEHGRGFAVVAEEVRTLASRSSEASQEIRQLIDASTSHTHSGAELVRSAGQTMKDIVASVARVTDVIAEISAGAKEQSNGIGQINTAVAEMDTMTQQNAAMVQQSSSSAGEMKDHAQRLSQLVDSFVLGEEQRKMAAPRSEQRPVARPAACPAARPVAATQADDWEEF